MKKYSVLIIGIQCYYGHIREFIINLKKTNPLVDITLVTSNMSDEVEKELNQYTKSIIHHKSFLGRFRIRPLVMMVNMYYYFKEFILLRLRGRFDIVNIHFANRHIKFAMPFIKMMTKNIVISPWGSDVLRVEGDKVIGDLRKIYSQANYVTVGKDSQIGKYLIERFNVDSRKMVKLGWGGESFDYIQSNKDRISVEEAKERFGLSGRYVITCGYNTQKEQRHEKIIEAVYSVKNQLPDNLVLLFPFTYGKTTNSDIYTESIIEKCKQMGLCAMPVYEHLDLEDLLNRKVDLVKDGTLLPFAVETANRDKVLIYEKSA